MRRLPVGRRVSVWDTGVVGLGAVVDDGVLAVGVTRVGTTRLVFAEGVAREVGTGNDDAACFF